MLKTYRDLTVWQAAMELVDTVYTLTREFPSDERFGLTSQLRRAAVSVPTNIAQGHGRTHRGDYLRFLSIARGSLCEVETLLIVASRQGVADRDRLTATWKQAQPVGKMLRRLIRTLTDRGDGLDQTPNPKP
jgi:four helix bundle protein